MNGLALVAALALAQAPGGEEPSPAAAADRDTPAVSAPAAPSPPADAGGEGEARPHPTSTPTPTSTSHSPANPRSAGTPTSLSPTGGERRGEGARPSTPPVPLTDREEAERAARAFLEALARGDAAALAGLAAERFSFDGEVLSGKESIRRTWREILTARVPAAPAAIGALEVLQATDAATRYGKPPARIAPLVQKGVMVGIGDVGGRTVVLFLARERGRMAVLGMHD